MPLKLNSTGGGSITLEAPNTASTRTLTLPDGDGTVQMMKLETAKASTSGTNIDFTGIPNWVKRITVMFNGVSTNGTSSPIIQLGTSSGATTSGYTSTGTRLQDSSAVSVGSSTAGFLIQSISAANIISGAIQICNVSSNVWVAQGAFTSTASSSFVFCTTGLISLASTLDRVRVTTVNGTDTFDAGSINVLYEG